MIFCAMSRWQPMASMVTTAPSMANRSSSAGMATISLDLSPTLTCPSTMRWRAAKAETTWMVFGPLLLVGAPHRLAVDGDHFGHVFVSAAVHATKQRWNATGSSLARMMPNWSCEGVPFL